MSDIEEENIKKDGSITGQGLLNDDDDDAPATTTSAAGKKKGKGKGKGGKKTAATTTKKKKGKGKGGAGVAEIRKIKDKVICSFCANSMTQSVGATIIEVKNKKVPKGPKGQYLFKSPGVAEGKMAGVLCDSCVHTAETVMGGVENMAAKTVVGIRNDGSVHNLPAGNY